MNIAVCYGQGEPSYATASAIVHALQSLGETVIRVGPYYRYAPGGGVPGAHVTLEDKDFPERYSYEEVLKQTGHIDLLLQVEPHFYITGNKPVGLRSAYYFTDPHRGGHWYFALAKEGNFDAVFCGQPAFLDLFRSVGTEVYSLPIGFDLRRHREYEAPPRCDISFCGEVGRHVEWTGKDEIGEYVTQLSSLDEAKLKFGPPFYDYAERAALLTMLSSDFDMRIYRTPLDATYMDAIQAGRIGFNRSLLGDVGLRCWEVMGAGRYLFTDAVPQLEKALGPPTCYWTYQNLTRFASGPFLLEYARIREVLSRLLARPERIADMSMWAQKSALENTWQHRMSQLLTRFRVK